MTTEIQCKHDEFLDYLNGRHLGYCRACGRTMEYSPVDGDKPIDVTEEFGGKCPFPPVEASGQAVIIPAGSNTQVGGLPQRGNWDITPRQAAQARQRGTSGRHATSPEALAASAEREPHQRSNFDRMRWYLEHKDAILADVHELGPTQARKKWDIPSSTFSHQLRQWGIVVDKAKRKPLGAGKRCTTARGRYYATHAVEIEADLRSIGPAETQRKWGMGSKWLERHFPLLSSRRLWKASLSGQLAQAGTEQTAEQTAQREPCEPAPDGDGHGAVDVALPAWNEGWAPEVQVAWLRSATTLALAGVIASIKPTAAVAA